MEIVEKNGRERRDRVGERNGGERRAARSNAKPVCGVWIRDPRYYRKEERDFVANSARTSDCILSAVEGALSAY